MFKVATITHKATTLYQWQSIPSMINCIKLFQGCIWVGEPGYNLRTTALRGVIVCKSVDYYFQVPQPLLLVEYNTVGELDFYYPNSLDQLVVHSCVHSTQYWQWVSFTTHFTRRRFICSNYPELHNEFIWGADLNDSLIVNGQLDWAVHQCTLQ